MPKTDHIELGDGTRIPILYEDKTVMALDKPAGWILAPDAWENTRRNLQRAVESCVIGRTDYWVRSRGLKFLRFIHRLDAETSGVILFAKSEGALRSIGQLFAKRAVTKTYLAVVRGRPRCVAWTCKQPLGPIPGRPGFHRVDPEGGKEAETHFRVLETTPNAALLEARPITGRTHQIRLHLLHSGNPVVGDALYGQEAGDWGEARDRGVPLGLRAMRLAFVDPFRGKPVLIEAPCDKFLAEFHFSEAALRAAPPAEAPPVVRGESPFDDEPEDAEEETQDLDAESPRDDASDISPREEHGRGQRRRGPAGSF